MFHPITWGWVICMIVVLLLLVVSALVSGSEVAYFSLSPGSIKRLEESKSRRSEQVLKLLTAPEELLATILITNNFVNIAIVVLASYSTHLVVDFTDAPVWGFVFQVVIITFLLLLIGEVIPKIYATQNTEKTARLMAYPLTALEKIFYPLVQLLMKSTSFVSKRVQKKQNISIDDLSEALEITSKSIAENENILKGIVKFGNIDVHSMMTPRVDVESVDTHIKFSELIDLINESGYSRIPVYDDIPDHIVGILYVKDLLPYVGESDDFDWQKLVREAYFVPENKKIDDLLEEFQEKKTHMAVIIDEYGSMAGIVTLEDILEEIVGDIADESDDDEQDYEQIGKNTYLFDGKVLLNDFYRFMHIEDTFFDAVKGEADTLAGIILELKGEIPVKGDCIDYKNLSFCVESVDNRRIKQIKVKKNEISEK